MNVDVTDTRERSLDLKALRNGISGLGPLADVGLSFTGTQNFGASDTSSDAQSQISLNFDGDWDESSVVLRWLNTIGETEISHRQNVQTGNGQMVSVERVIQQKFVSKDQPRDAVAGQHHGQTALNIETASADSGVVTHILPTIVRDGVNVQMAVSIGEVLSLETVDLGVGASARLPTVASTNQLLNFTLRSGETRLVANLGRRIVRRGAKRLPWLPILGRSQAASAPRHRDGAARDRRGARLLAAAEANPCQPEADSSCGAGRSSARAALSTASTTSSTTSSAPMWYDAPAESFSEASGRMGRAWGFVKFLNEHKSRYASMHGATLFASSEKGYCLGGKVLQAVPDHDGLVLVVLSTRCYMAEMIGGGLVSERMIEHDEVQDQVAPHMSTREDGGFVGGGSGVAGVDQPCVTKPRFDRGERLRRAQRRSGVDAALPPRVAGVPAPRPAPPDACGLRRLHVRLRAGAADCLYAGHGQRRGHPRGAPPGAGGCGGDGGAGAAAARGASGRRRRPQPGRLAPTCGCGVPGAWGCAAKAWVRTAIWCTKGGIRWHPM